ncbi:MAG: hypothetical protein BWX70_01205 [Verrucomicrobia bacterium ADurb.Bin070]|nr:MAG: hypothetical protein BWX70_01205 [Verrucomicrobia bacterium ADurb.Bin070]
MPSLVTLPDAKLCRHSVATGLLTNTVLPSLIETAPCTTAFDRTCTPAPAATFMPPDIVSGS